MRRTNVLQTDFFLHYLFLLIGMMAVLLALTGLQGCAAKDEKGSEIREVDVLAEEETSSDDGQADISPQDENIYVYVCGEVATPGVFELPPDSRVFEAIRAAGGMTGKAADSYLNQAEKLTDGQQVYVPSEKELSEKKLSEKEQAGTIPSEEGASGKTPAGIPEADDGKVDLNTASKEELMTLSGIGEVKAEAIIRYREEKGGFTSIEELKEIEGIKDGVFGKVKDQIKI